ncbi:MAG TPA: DNA alkylation repair protein [Candidatus Blautia merdigallinarum]|uniref:DNA alkylation repair protein n=1 Tax=Candidatus Blautia merdigallinarum TaxID=2838495 RepID=A0A9D2SL15_9FIRM|nr:DNA alkylation repair protein [Candidatus Blautia merdigallinarum]
MPSSVTQWVREELKKNTDPDYREFHKSLVPGMGNFLGVRVPQLRRISKKAAREDYWRFAKEADTEMYEELMVRGMMIGYARLSKEEQRRELEAFVPYINNWAICDCCCATYKFMKKGQEEWFAFLKVYADSVQEYEIRFALVSMLDFFINEEYIDQVLEILGKVRHEGYYVKMAAAWAVSVCYVKFPEKTEVFLRKNLLDDFTHNKAIQKIRESYRVSKEEKERLKELRRERVSYESGSK